jgi:alkylhydroperoxidase family enzyme
MHERPDTDGHPGRDTDQVIALTLAEHPAIAASLTAAHVAAWEVVDPAVLELCRLRIAQVLGNTDELAVRTPAAVAAGLDEATIQQLASWPTASAFGARERACLAFCEQSLIDVSNVTSSQTEAISAELGVQGMADFVSALLVIEQRQRLRLAWAQLFPEETPDGS